MTRRLFYSVSILSVAAMLAGCAPMHQSNAQSALAQGNYDSAATEIQAALASDPDNLQLKALAAQIFTDRGAKHYQAGEMLAAQQDFQSAVGYQPTDSRAYDYLGLIAFQQHDWQQAIDYGTRSAGYAGRPDPVYVQQAREALHRMNGGGSSPVAASYARKPRRAVSSSNPAYSPPPSSAATYAPPASSSESYSPPPSAPSYGSPPASTPSSSSPPPAGSTVPESE